MNDLEELKSMGVALEILAEQIEETEALLSALKEKRRKIEEVDLPTRMDELGISEITLASGGKISVIDFIQTRIKDEFTVFQWLRETHNDGIIKNEIKAVFDRGQDERTQRVMEDLAARGVPYEHKQSIHPQTLKSFVKEVLSNPELRESLPREAFGLYEGRKVVFK